MYILKVLVEHNTYSLKDSFYYVSNEEVKKGSRVNITFNNQHLVGFVVETIYQDLSLKEIENNLGLKLTFIDSVIDDKPIINDELFELAIKLAKNLFGPHEKSEPIGCRVDSYDLIKLNLVSCS